MQVSPKELAELKTNFMELYDDNKDGKIEIREVSSYTVKKVIVFLHCSF
jgi:Ca2+-binding EF-hand superfamily protein